MPDEMTRTHVLIPRRLLEQVDELVGPRRRSEFISIALEEKLDRSRLSHLARTVAGSLAGVDIPGWESSEAAAEWVRAIRQGDEERLERTQRD